MGNAYRHAFLAAVAAACVAAFATSPSAQEATPEVKKFAQRA